MPIVQALHWLHDMLPSAHDSILKRLKKILWTADSAAAIRQDLQNGLDALPGWMRQVVDDLLRGGDAANQGRGASLLIPSKSRRRDHVDDVRQE